MIQVTTTRNSQRGFIHKKIGQFAKTALGVVGAVGIPGVSGVARIGSSFLGGGSRNLAFNRARAAQMARGAATARLTLPPGLTPRGPGGILGALPGVPGGISGFAQEATGAICPKGHHLNKSNYFLIDGTHVPAMSRCVKNRRRNNDNGRAAMRAARRLLGRKKSQDSIDKALRAFAPRGRARSKGHAPRAAGPIVVAS